MQQIRLLIQLLEKGYSFRAIAAELKLSRQPVTEYAKRLKNSCLSWEQLRQLPDAELSAIVYQPVVLPDFTDNVRRIEFNTKRCWMSKNVLVTTSFKRELKALAKKTPVAQKRPSSQN